MKIYDLSTPNTVEMVMRFPVRVELARLSISLDYINNPYLRKGVERAVDRVERNIGIGLDYLPINILC